MVGAARTVHALVRGGAIAARGHAVRLVTLGPVVPLAGALEVCTRPIPTTLSGSLRAARGMLRDVHGFRPDLLHVHYAGGKLGTMAALSGVRPLVVTVMGGDVQPEQHLDGLHPLERRATRRLLEQADLLLAKSDALRREIARYGDFEGKTETVRWGIDVDRFRRDTGAGQAWRARFALPREARLVLSPRILRPLYNVHLVVEAWPEVRARVPGAVLLLTEHRADEGYRERLRVRIREMGLGDTVRFVGAVDYGDMPGLLSAAEAVVSVPFSDGLPQTLFEAMASGTPAVVGRLDAYREVVEDGEHVLFTDLAPAAIAGAVVRLLTERDLAGRLARSGLQKVREVASLPREAERVEGFYRKLLERSHPPTPLVERLVDGATLLLR